jgi:AcrR family transcriptional regulator
MTDRGTNEHGLGRSALLDAAAVLMDERGIDNVSLNEISRASGHRNRSAVSYHFGSRDTVIRELVDRTMNVIDAERNALLDHLETTGAPLTERTTLEVLVGPFTRQLRSKEGRRYVRLCAQLLNHPRFVADPGELAAANSSVQRGAQYLARALADLPRDVAAERRSQAAGFIIRACADQARLLDADPPPRPVLGIEAFTANLVDVLLGLLKAPTTVRAGQFPSGSAPAGRAGAEAAGAGAAGAGAAGGGAAGAGAAGGGAAGGGAR